MNWTAVENYVAQRSSPGKIKTCFVAEDDWDTMALGHKDYNPVKAPCGATNAMPLHLTGPSGTFYLSHARCVKPGQVLLLLDGGQVEIYHSLARILTYLPPPPPPPTPVIEKECECGFLKHNWTAGHSNFCQMLQLGRWWRPKVGQ